MITFVLAVAGILAPQPSATCSPTRLVSLGSNVGIHGTDQDDIYIYFGDDFGNLARVAKAGGAVQSIANESGQTITGVAVDTADIYYAVNGAIKKIPKGGGAITTLVSGLSVVGEMKTDDAFVYWSAIGTQQSNGTFNADGQIARVGKSGGKVDILAQNLAGASLRFDMDASDVYFGENGGGVGFPGGPRGVRRVPKIGGAVVAVSSDQPAWLVTIDGPNVYYSTGFGTSAGADGLYRVPKSGGSSTRLVGSTGLTQLGGVSEGLVYFSSDNQCGRFGFLASVPVAGGSTTRLAENLNCGAGDKLLFDGCSIYASPMGSIERICKPDCTPSGRLARRRAVAFPRGGGPLPGGLPQLAGAPVASAGSVARGGTITLTIPISANTRRVLVWMGDAATGAASPDYGEGLASPNNATTATVSVTIPRDLSPGRFYPSIQLDTDPSGEGSNYVTYNYNPFLSQTTYSLTEGTDSFAQRTELAIPFIDVQ